MSSNTDSSVNTYDAPVREPFHTNPRTLETVRSRIVAAVQRTVADADVEGVVVAMSGGLDSTVTTVLAVEALGSDRVLGLGLPCHKAEQTHVTDARTIADGLGIEFEEIQLRPLLETFEDTVVSVLEPELETAERPTERNRALGNVIARLRMGCAYYTANRQHRLVLGAANRSELLLGYFTKYGDGAADAFPIGDLYKTEVRALAKSLGVPRRIVSKEPTAGFWADQTDAGELGAPYDVIDPLLRRLVDGVSVTAAADAVGVDCETARAIASLYTATAHKRTLPPTPGIAGRDDSSAGAGEPLE